VISKKRFVNKLRELDYRFKEQLHHQELWRKKGGTHFVLVPRKNQLDELYVIQALRQCGCKADEIQEFIRDCHS
jgi:hypothetical protein